MARRVLAAGGAPSFQLLASSFLQRAGCRFFEAASLEEAIAAGERYRPALVLVSDIPGGATAVELCRAVRATPWGSAASLIVASDVTDEALADRCFEAGCDDFVPSTTKVPELTSKAASALKLPHRMHFRVVCDLEVMGRSDAGPFIGLARNLGAGGALVECAEMAEIGETLTVTFSVDENMDSITLHGRVVRLGWDDTNGSHLLALSFVDVPADVRARIETFVESHR